MPLAPPLRGVTEDPRATVPRTIMLQTPRRNLRYAYLPGLQPLTRSAGHMGNIPCLSIKRGAIDNPPLGVVSPYCCNPIRTTPDVLAKIPPTCRPTYPPYSPSIHIHYLPTYILPTWLASPTPTLLSEARTTMTGNPNPNTSPNPDPRVAVIAVIDDGYGHVVAGRRIGPLGGGGSFPNPTQPPPEQ